MSFKVVRDSLGAVVCFGPNNDNYEPTQAYVIEETQPISPGPSPLEQIRALEAQYADAQAKLTRQSLLTIALDRACADSLAAGLSREEVHALLMGGDNGYRALFNLEQQVEALRVQL